MTDPASAENHGATEAGVIVVGSLTVDVTAWSAERPAPGETLIGTGATMVAGGKGANQVLAARRMGVPAAMVGQVGDDDLSRIVIENLRAADIAAEEVAVLAEGRTGIAHIRVVASGENDIVIVPFANDALRPEAAVAALRRARPGTKVLLTQLEIPLETALAALDAAREAGLTTILDPAPAAPLPEDGLRAVDIVTPNEVEAGVITGTKVVDRSTAVQAGDWFLARGTGAAIVTLGAEGAVLVLPDRVVHLTPPAVRATDTTAAGDAFTGALGAALARGASLLDATRVGVAAGALAVQTAGASTSLPTRAAVERVLHEVRVAADTSR